MPRTSTSLTALAVILASTLVQGAEARTCYYDRFGRYRCRGLLGGTVAGIIVACIIPVLFALLLLCFCIRRRRSRKAVNEAYAQQQAQNPQMYQQPSGYYPPYGETQQPPYNQQQSYGGQPQYGYGNEQQQGYRTDGGEGGYAPPPGPPPQGDYTQPPAGTPPPAESQYPAQYQPPPGPPPAAHTAGPKTGGESAAYYNRT